jgi:competence protein ComEA
VAVFCENKKMIALCVIPIIAVAALIGFEVIHGQDNRSEPLNVNKGMKVLLEQNKKQTVAPAIVETTTKPKAAELPSVSVQTETSAPSKEKAKPKPKQKVKPKATSKPKTSTKTQNTDFKVNLNTALTQELMELSGIGESKAKAIITYREAHPFQTLDELMKVKGIGPKIFEKIKAHLVL